MNTTTEYQNINVNRKYKDSLFRIVFSDKKDLLDLYNAINGTDYQNVDDLEVNTLENVIYMSVIRQIKCCLIMQIKNVFLRYAEAL